MRKGILITGLLTCLAFPSFADVELNLEEIEKKLEILKEKHALECSPTEVGIVESYIESLKDEKRMENGKVETYLLKSETKKSMKIEGVSTVNYPVKIKYLLSVIEKNINSDKDGDGIPCYKEIELGLNPNIPDKAQKEVKVATEPQEMKPSDVITKNEIKEVKEKQALEEPVRVHFYLNSVSIKKEYLPYLNVVARYLKTHPDVKVKIVGYTDNIGSKAYNDKLALKRAETVKKYLVKMGIDPNRILIEGVGKDKYIVSNKNEIDRFTNRRAEFYVINLAE
ncbi:OmpA family protein [Sulfurihydrogenibium azorense]|uniref:Putative OmpA/MotB n=1 Tax=Sulfurihydrogenibium azorense (strain DSM 15241 / OCM 825 / Az-Fu1) TaxID=204536 RepID=C1DU63_SULAA|nr:OmpA family protein [Sulfurihydrogenibium azorense]ACN98475.1 putative OmpA/MotB [Sulfurihydrogenibium azorense Az-Fu1]MDM7273158.1 OmpA family protein [Sulfurihydrogenibium azorense]